jgi:O-methyltransferase
MAKVYRKLNRFIIPRIKSFLMTDVRTYEILARQDFFFKAFKAIAFNGISGDYAEFGCYDGGTFAMAYKEIKRHKCNGRLWAFDSFQGLPPPEGDKDRHPQWSEGRMGVSLEKFRAKCKSRGIPASRYSVVPGFYNETLPNLSPADAPDNICLAYIDCDLYSSTKSVLEFLKPRLKHGMIIAFDDYFCWSESQISGERRALLEVFADIEDFQLTPYIQFNWAGNSYLVEKTVAF